MQVTTEDTFAAVVRLIDEGHKPLALDFASATNPGGGWRRGQRGTQEECLCHQSDLGLWLEKTAYPMGRDEARYVPAVTVSKTARGTALPKKYRCAVVASELHAISASSERYLVQRVEALFQLAKQKGHDVLVLGAWGCGAFGETPDDLAILSRVYEQVARRWPGVKPVYAMFSAKNAKIVKQIVTNPRSP